MSRPIIYDLTELLLASTGRFRFYGIARTVAEVGRCLARLDPAIRFGIWVRGYDAFHEIRPVTGPDGTVDFPMPEGVCQLRIRRHHPTPNPLRDGLLAAARPAVSALNRRRWARAGEALRPIDMDGVVLTTAARPKLVADYAEAFAGAGAGAAVRLAPFLHDMIPLHEAAAKAGGGFASTFLCDNRRVIEASDLILVNSAFTATEVAVFSGMGVLPALPPVATIPLVHECPPGEGPVEIAPPTEPYVLAVGAATGRKNLEVVFDAMLHLLRTGRRVPLLVLAGAVRERTRRYLSDARFDPIRARVIERDSPGQADLVALYEGAVALVIASRMEGWGLPAGEALWLGTPVLCADVPALREVAGDLGLYFDPDDAPGLAGHMARLMEDESLAAAQRARIANARGGLRTWTDVARDYRDALEALT